MVVPAGDQHRDLCDDALIGQSGGTRELGLFMAI